MSIRTENEQGLNRSSTDQFDVKHWHFESSRTLRESRLNRLYSGTQVCPVNRALVQNKGVEA